MNPNLIFDLLELAISLTRTQLANGDATQTLMDLVQKSVQAYQDHTGETLDPSLIKGELQNED
jgi:hypothetical protein